MTQGQRETHTVSQNVVALNLKGAQSTIAPLTTLERVQLDLLQKLQRTLVLEELVALFSEQLQQLVPHDSYCYLYRDLTVRTTHPQRASHNARYNLTLDDQYLGEMVLYRQTRFDESELHLIESLLGTLVYPLRNTLLYQDAVNAAMTDALTGAGNKRAFDYNLHREVALARRHRTELSLIMFDVDWFKRINDTYGHAAGDEVLREMSELVRDNLRQTDQLFRFGGEEFVVLLGKTNLPQARLVAERIRTAVANYTFLKGKEDIRTSISAGITHLQAGDTRDTLIRRADDALYEAKRSGRNRVMAAAQPRAADQL
ncbi:GGDEF domain-containing protein [Hahella sp. SMD15-11]|uniref:diguanylate cyclase n=1 Tax=Thermohahella caldifontis TaxID=3142973 RepID=A0AB39V0S1_9GAMM